MLMKSIVAMVGALLVGLGGPLYADQAAGLSDQEVNDLLFMREEEKMARDVYSELYRHFKENDIEMIILARIAASEQRHMDAMLNLLDKYQLNDPAAGLEPGEFDNSVLAALYQNLVSDSEANETILGEPAEGGKVSPGAALYVGAWIEERDMLDIMHAIANTSRADIVGVYTNLLCGSREHLRAFVGQLGAADYQPQLLHPAADAGSEVKPEETLEFWLGSESDVICL
jgi:hypothetical protein